MSIPRPWWEGLGEGVNCYRSSYALILPKAQSAIFLAQKIQAESGKKLMEQCFQLCKRYQALFDQSWFGHGPKEHAEFRMPRHMMKNLSEDGSFIVK